MFTLLHAVGRWVRRVFLVSENKNFTFEKFPAIPSANDGGVFHRVSPVEARPGQRCASPCLLERRRAEISWYPHGCVTAVVHDEIAETGKIARRDDRSHTFGTPKNIDTITSKRHTPRRNACSPKTTRIAKRHSIHSFLMIEYAEKTVGETKFSTIIEASMEQPGGSLESTVRAQKPSECLLAGYNNS